MAKKVLQYWSQDEENAEFEVDSNDVSEVNDDLQTTLHVSTVFPASSSSVVLEVATIRSPYSFDFEDGKSTRFVTIILKLSRYQKMI